jgi:hypothetical protein
MAGEEKQTGRGESGFDLAVGPRSRDTGEPAAPYVTDCNRHAKLVERSVVSSMYAQFSLPWLGPCPGPLEFNP